MKKISAKEAYRILKRVGLSADNDGVTFFAYDEKNDEIYSFDNKAERDAFVDRANTRR